MRSERAIAKIVAVRAHLLSTPIPPEQRVESGAGRKLARQMCLIQVVTEDGLVGIGSPSGPYDLAILGRAVTDVLGPHLLGKDARDTEYLWHHLYHVEVARNLGHRGVGIAALSGIDMALWDLKGKMAGLPLYQLLGGRYHQDGVRVYASSIYWNLTPEQAASEAISVIEQGFRAVKVKVGRHPRQDLANLAAIRSAVGEEIEILVDANQSMTQLDALAFLRGLEDLGCYWFEEPLLVDDIAGHAELRRNRHRVRIASGENLYTRHSFREFVQAGALDVLQADVSRAGGISEVRKISDLAAVNHLDWNPHTFNDLITVVANLHLVTASPHQAMFEWDITYNRLMTDLADLRLEVEGGEVQAPDGPGLGLEIDWDFVHTHAWQGEPAIGDGHDMRG